MTDRRAFIQALAGAVALLVVDPARSGPWLDPRQLRGLRVYGKRGRALCPFHRHKDGSPERCPSLRINFATGVFFCFACKSEGDLAQLLSKVE
jgi:hypothetical protein